MAKAIIFDTETTNAEESAEVIEAAWLECYDDGRPGGSSYSERFKPAGPITFGAMATHHIMPSELETCRPSAELVLPVTEFLIGHNVDFDWKVVGSPAVKRICTLALCRYLWPELDSHKQGVVMYFLFGEEAREMVTKAHSALDDVCMCRDILQMVTVELMQRGIPCDTWQELWEASEVARVPTIMSFGKHKGTPVKDVPRDYMRWYLNQPDNDEYMRKAFLEVIQGGRS